MSKKLIISEFYCNYKALIYIELKIKIAMITEDKVTEIFCMVDDFCKFFAAMIIKYTLKPTGKRKSHRNSTMSKAEIMQIMIFSTIPVIVALNISTLKKYTSSLAIYFQKLFLITVL